MKKISTLFIIAFLFGSLTSFGQVIISQIYEGTSFNKFIEITNMGTSPVDLASPQLTVKTFNNKADLTQPASYTLNLNGTLAPGQCYLIRHHSAITPAYAVAYTPGDTNNVANFNGVGTGTPVANTDIVTLYNGTTLVDVFAWGTFQYSNQSYYRNANITGPNSTWTVGEWTTVTNAVVDGAAINTIERLGFHLIGGVTTPIISITSPVNGYTVYSPNVDVAFTLLNFVMGTTGHIQYTLDGGAALQHTLTTPVPLTGLSAGPHSVILTLVDNSNVPLVPLAADTVNFIISLTYPAFKTIYQIQYTTLTNGDSPINDSVVSTTGLVTASFASGYFIQAGTSPWNGLYVFDNLHSPAVGDSILLIGTVSEYFNYTELTTVAGIMTVASGKPLPTPLALTTNTVKSEQYEGMLVHLDNALCTKTSTSGWWKVFQGADTCEIGKLMYIYPSPVIGTYYDVTGCVNYTFNLFTVEARNAADVSVHVGISENTANSNISIYPNPATSELNVSNMENVNQIRIANLLGETVGNYSVSGQTTAINVNSLPNGIYFVSLLKDNSVMVTRKFIKL